MSGVDRDLWRQKILAHAAMSNATKVLMLVMHDSMNNRGQVSVPRRQLADILNVNPVRISERIREAQQLGVLDTVSRGRPGQTAVYVATYPTGTAIRTKRQRTTGPHIRTSNGYGIQNQAGVRTSVPSGEPAHAQIGTHIQYASSTNPSDLRDQCDEALEQEQERSNGRAGQALRAVT